MVARALGDRDGAGVAHAEPLADHAAQEHLAGRGTVEDHVACDDLILGGEGRCRVRRGDDPAARQSLAQVVVGVPGQAERDPARQEGAERLPCAAGERDVQRVVGQALAAPAPRHLVAEHGADGAVHVPHRKLEPDRRGVGEGALGKLDQRVVERLFQAVVLLWSPGA